MKTLKSILVLSILLVSSITFAQAPGGGQRGGQQGAPPIPSDKQIEKIVSNLAEEIALSEEQEVKVLVIYKTHFAQVKEKTSGNSRPKREEMNALQAALEKNVKAELTKEQKNGYEVYLKEQASQRPKR
ncbi:MAG: hypothetical protein EOM83_02805 [Clostridia bacterium]|nr:hypothetical protein [Clostridia bacterium]